MAFNVILLNDVENSLQELIAYFESSHDVEITVISALDDFQMNIEQKKVHLVLANSQCRKLDPFSICQSLRASPSLRFLPFLYLTQKDDAKSIKKAYEMGVNECIGSPFSLNELFIRMNSHILNYQTLKKCLLQNERLAIIVATDSLTKVSNRMHLQTILFQSIKEFVRYDRIFSIIYFQISDIRKINTLYGFAKGDKLLKDVAQSVSKTLRESDIIARIGGSDFVVFAPKSSIKDADLLVKKLNAKLLSEKHLKS